MTWHQPRERRVASEDVSPAPDKEAKGDPVHRSTYVSAQVGVGQPAPPPLRSQISHRQIEADGISIHVAEAGDGPLVLLIHGVPELWYSWRFQLGSLAEAGYHVVAADLRGCGRTDAPARVESYSMLNLVADVDYYATEYGSTSFTGALNRYRNLDRDWEELGATEGAVIEQPTLFVGGSRDGAVLFGGLEAMKTGLPNLRGVNVLPGCGHWVQQEKAREVNQMIIRFLSAEAPPDGRRTSPDPIRRGARPAPLEPSGPPFDHDTPSDREHWTHIGPGGSHVPLTAKESTQGKERDPMIDSIETFLDQWSAAEQAGDTMRLDGLLADDFAGIGPLGFTLPRHAWLDRHRSRDLRYDSFSLVEVQTRVYGSAAVVTARNNTGGSYQGHPIPEATRATLVLLSEDGRWRLAAIHMSFIAGTPGAPPLPAAANRPVGQSSGPPR
jgi:ketosteroid isomerase-like protein